MPLSEAVATLPRELRHAHASSTRIALADCGICTLDALPHDRAASVTSLLVADNALESLAGVEQFRQLRQLSLAHNHLETVATILPNLQRLPNLRVLSLEGNPCWSLPGYRSTLLLGLPQLLSLDGVLVRAEERAEARDAHGSKYHQNAIRTASSFAPPPSRRWR